MMRRSSKGYRRPQLSRPRRTDTGTVKSIERQRETGSIAPDTGARVNADTGFSSADVAGQDGFSALRIGDHVEFESAPDHDRVGYARATKIERLAPGTGTDAGRGNPG